MFFANHVNTMMNELVGGGVDACESKRTKGKVVGQTEDKVHFSLFFVLFCFVLFCLFCFV